MKSSRKILVSVCYRKPSCDPKEWLKFFTSFLESCSTYDKVLVTGDFNFPDLTWNSCLVPNTTKRNISAGSFEFRELTFDFFLSQVNMHPTRINSILDLVLSTTPEDVINLSCLEPSTMNLSSDHKLLFFDLKLCIKHLGHDSRKVYDFSRADWNALLNSLNNADLCPLTQTDVNDDWLRWKNLFLDTVTKYIPQRLLKRRSSPPWIDKEVKCLLRKKDLCRKKAKHNLCHALWQKYRDLRRKSKSMICDKRKQYFQTLPNLLRSSSKKFWSVFKSVSKNSSIPSKMKWCENDELHCSASNPTEIANMFNRYFYSVFQPSDSNIDEIDFSESNCDQTSTIASIVLTTEEIYHVLSNLDENKATGPDKIPAALLKNCASSISKSLCELFNKSLASGKLPDEWKLSHIIPIPKKCPNDEVTNYRPISLLSVVSKVLERCIYNQLIVHVSSQLHHLQFGFLRGKSTTSQLLHVINEINKALENREQIDSIYLDFAKAFDKVDHILLLKKLRNFGITGKLLNWFNNYLSNRLQKVTVLGSTSQPLPILSGVPQGSILGPLLFLVFVNDLPDSISRQSSVALFADDTKCYRPVTRVSDCEILQSDLHNLVQWCSNWKMDLNLSKCAVSHMSRNRQPIHYDYELLGHSIKVVDAQKDLGVVLSSDLKWNKHVDITSSKANRMLGFVRRVAMNINDFQVRKVLYLSLVRGLFAYASQVWSPQTVSNIVKIEKVQRRATKFILSLPYKTDISYKERLQTIHILPVCYWHEYLDMVYIYKCLVYKSDENISIKRCGRVTRMNDTTNGILLEIPRSRTVAYKNSFYVRAPSVWNTLPKDLRDTTRSVSSFKTNLCQFYNKLLDDIFDPEDSRTYKTVCIKCHSTRSLLTLSTSSCC